MKRKSINQKKRSTRPGENNRSSDHNTEQQKCKEPLSQFLDASCGVTPATFAARRLPEIKALWRKSLYLDSLEKLNNDKEGFKKEDNWKSEGKKLSVRHLRRRTGSYHPRRHHRYPNLKSSSQNTEITFNARRARRRPALLRKLHANFASESPPNKCYWLPTHHFHAKRFHMTNLFNWNMPLVHTNRGVGPSLRYDVTLQDASYLTARPLEIQLGLDLEKAEYDKTLCSLLVTQILPQICGPQLHFADDSFLQGHKMMDFVLYYPNSYPCRAIGPVQLLFLSSKHNFGQSRSEESKHVTQNSTFTIFAHPSIRSRIKEVFELMTAKINEHYKDGYKQSPIEDDVNTNTSPILHVLDGSPKALLQVRGNRATKCVLEALSPKFEYEEKSDSDDEHSEESFEEKRINVWKDIQQIIQRESIGENEVDRLIDDIKLRAPLEHDSVLHSFISTHDKSLIEIQPTQNQDQYPFPCMLISKSPNYKRDSDNGVGNNTLLNSHVSGLDILLPPALTKFVFQILHNKGARAIGLVEEAAAKLEADPPLPLFPRDYPDTEEGKLYWMCDVQDTIEKQNQTNVIYHGERDENARSHDWYTLRSLWEYRKDRCGTLIKKLKKKNSQSESVIESSKVTFWKDIVSLVKCTKNNIEGSNYDLVVVRGKAHGGPFMQALSGSTCDFKNLKCMKTKTRRPRRKVRNPNQPIDANFLQDSELVDQHVSLCTTMISSLSLPALLRCFLVIDGKGAIGSKAIISEYSAQVKESSQNDVHDNECIGVVVSGAFSPGRGKYLASGFVGARRFLHSIAKACKQKKNLVMVNSSFHNRLCDTKSSSLQTHTKHVALVVSVQNRASKSLNRRGFLTIIF